jgi:PHD/YefM family antitoxin component YafN of YafNO toxin-antitoxin module
MRIFPAADLQRNPSEVQRAALKEPVFLTYHDKPRYVMMSLEDFVRLQGAKIVAGPDAFPESVMRRIKELEDAYPYVKPAMAGGLAALIEEEEEAGDDNP